MNYEAKSEQTESRKSESKQMSQRRRIGAWSLVVGVAVCLVSVGCSESDWSPLPREEVGVSRAAVTLSGVVSSPAFTSFQPNVKWHGRIQSMDADPANLDFAIAASDHGGAFRTNDGGATWTRLDGLKANMLADVAICAENPQVVAITAFQSLGLTTESDTGGIWLSSDAGDSWTHAQITNSGAPNGTPHSGFGVAFLPGSACQTLYAGTTFGLARCSGIGASSCDNIAVAGGGAVFSVLPRPGPVVHTHTADGYRRWDGTAWSAKCNPVDPVTPCAAGLVPSPGLFGSTTFTLQVRTLAMSPFNEQVLFAGGFAIGDDGTLTTDYQAYESDDGGTTWTALDIRKDPGARLAHVAAVPTRVPGRPDDFDLYFIHGPNLSRTTCTEAGGTASRCLGQAWEEINLRPAFGGEPGVPRDGSACGDNANTPCPHNDPSVVLFDPATHCPVFLPGDGGVLKLAAGATPPDCGETGQWFTFGSGLDALQVFEISGQVHPGGSLETDLFFSTQDNFVWASVPTAGGLTWQPGGLEGGGISVPHSALNRDNTVVTYFDAGGGRVVEALPGFPPDDRVYRALRWNYFPSSTGPDGLGKDRAVCPDMDGDAHCDGPSAAVECSSGAALPNRGVTCIQTACVERVTPEQEADTGNDGGIEGDFCQRLDVRGGQYPVAVEAGVYLQWDGGAEDTSHDLVAPIQLHLSLDGGTTWRPLPNIALGNVGDPVGQVRRPWGLAQISRDADGRVVSYHQTVGTKVGLVRVVDVLGPNPVLEEVDLTLPALPSPELLYSSAFVAPLSFVVDPNDANRLIAATDAGVRESFDGGHQWTADEGTAQLDSLATDAFEARNLISFGFDRTDPDRIVAGTAEAGAMSTLDGGQTWARLCGTDDIPLITRFFFDEVENNVYASSWGRGLWRVDPTQRQVPVFTTEPQDVTVLDCGPVDVGQAQAEDQCENPPVSVVVQAGLGAEPAEIYAGCADGVRPCGDFPRGTTSVPWTATDEYGDVATTTSNVTVDDQTPPLVTPPDDVTAAICGADELVVVGEATATDACIGDVPVVGAVISTNGEPLGTPIDVVAGEVALGVGTHVIEWTASDGITSSSATQTVVVDSVVQADGEFIVEDRAHVQDVEGNSAAVFNSGSGLTSVGGDGASVGDIVAGGAVSVNAGGIVDGDITAVGPVSVPATYEGTTTTVSSVALPELPTLPTFPPATGSNVTVGPGETVSLAPGSYADYDLNGNPSDEPFLVLSSGDYFFTALRLNADANILAEADTRIFVSGEFVMRDRAAILLDDGSGVLAPVFVGLAGGGETFLEASFSGTIAAPERTLILGVADNRSFTGSFFASTIHLRPGARLVCSPQQLTNLTCSDGELNGDETDTDCGGSCGSCPDGSTCAIDDDCQSLVCPGGICLPPTCSDGVKNGDETDTDCGGPDCDACVEPCNEATYEAEEMFHSTGGPFGSNAWNIWSNGFISTNHDFTPGPAVITVSALGQSAARVRAHMVVTVDGVQIGEANVAPWGFDDYQFFFSAAGGPREVRVIFDNDYFVPPADRNLIVDDITVDCADGP